LHYNYVYPFLKWAGGKRQLLEQYSSLIPSNFNRYYEPFIGGGALFFHLLPVNAKLCDVNSELINCYKVIKNNVKDLIPILEQHKEKFNSNPKEYFYLMRNVDLIKLSNIEKAARTIFLNRTCFNGLYRVNKQGKFNVPFGKYTNPSICDKDNLKTCSLILKKIDLAVCDFSDIENEVQEGDFVYLDPPYMKNLSNSFTDYTINGFGHKDHERLAEMFIKLNNKKAYVMLSNSNNDFIRNLYSNFQIDLIKEKRNINCNADKRGEINSIVIRNYITYSKIGNGE
jgi:DNA adenine methylase